MVPKSSSSLGLRTSRKKVLFFSSSAFNSSAESGFSCGSDGFSWAVSAATAANEVSSKVRRSMGTVYGISLRQLLLLRFGQPEAGNETSGVSQQRHGSRGVRQLD